MCEASAFIVQNGKEELVMENVDELFMEGDKVKIISLFGDREVLDARIKMISFGKSKIILEKK